MRALGALLAAVTLSTPAAAQTPDWKTVDAEALKSLQAVFSMHGDAEFAPVDAIGSAIRIIDEALVTTVSTR